MAHPGPGEAKLLVPGRHGPAIIGHGGGNSARHVDEFLAAGADFLEVDLWLHAGRLEARHERRIKFTPILFEKWYLRRAPRPHFGLDELLAASGRGFSESKRSRTGKCGMNTPNLNLIHKISAPSPHDATPAVDNGPTTNR